MKPRKPRTFHSACAFAVAVLADDEVKAATGKSMSLLRRASDPDDHAVEIRCADAAALEAMLLDHGHGPQFLTAFQDAIEQNLGHGMHHEPANLLERLADAVEKVGNISAELRAATHPDSRAVKRSFPLNAIRLKQRSAKQLTFSKPSAATFRRSAMAATSSTSTKHLNHHEGGSNARF